MHAALAFAARFPQHQAHDGALVFLHARDELALCWLIERVRRQSLDWASFHEPDLGNQLTAVAIDHRGASLCRKYRLALQGEMTCP